MLRAVPAPMREQLVRAGAPSFTLGSVCLVEHDGRVLVVQTEYRRGWGLPGGLLGRRETPEAGARREVLEEVGLAVDLVGAPVVIIDARQRLVDFLFRATLAAGVGPGDARAASVEIMRVEWVPAAEVEARVVSTDGHLVQKVRFYDSHPDGGLVYLDGAGRIAGPAG